jgi:nitrite reductase/ring-hydroxylating ferredoxin subunit
MIQIHPRYKPKPGNSSIISIKGHEYLLINQNDTFYLMDNLCPHNQASLGLGKIESDEVICPLHQYRFNFKTGKCSVERFPIQIYAFEFMKI